MNVYVVNPLLDSRWDELVARHPKASVFHGRGWLDALARTYGYQPIVLTGTPPGRPLMDGIVFCRVSSWITGTRLVSVPFADHCEPLRDEASDIRGFASWMQEQCDHQHWSYVELRPLSSNDELAFNLPNNLSYYFHTLDLTPPLAQIFGRFHKDSVQRRIRRAENAGLVYEVGHSERLLEAFYLLLLKTRRRHQMFPQPRAWFRNLFTSMSNSLQIRLARKGDTPIAALLTLRHGSAVVYKYGCSDQQFNNLGGTPLLFWRLIEESKESGATVLDFGRSELNNQGLITFKDRFGTTKTLLTYIRYPESKPSPGLVKWGERVARKVFSILPDSISPVAGSILYRHIG
jgi:CelD/BcsL family acetyltransferase involved in cellulose biosynthesis